MASEPPSRRRFLTGLIGAPIAQSASPAMHEQAADALGIRCHYQLIEVAGAGTAELRALLDNIKRIGFAGVNVTFPYKEAVIPLLDDLSPVAREIGAVIRLSSATKGWSDTIPTRRDLNARSAIS